MLYNNTKSFLDTVTKLMSESKQKFDQEQAELAEAQKALWEKKMGKKPLHPNQQKLDVHEPEKNELTAKDFEMLRAGKKAMKKEELVKDTLNHNVVEGSGPKEKQKTPYRDINSPESRAAAEKQVKKMEQEKAAEPGKKLLSKMKKEEVEQVDELKKSTVKSYADKKQAELDDVPPMPFKKPAMSKAENEKAAKGMMGALARLSGKKPTSESVNKKAELVNEKNKDTPGQHMCAVHVKNEEWGMGKTIHSQHAEPDLNGNIAWYDVMFEHGIEREVPAESLEVLVSESHKNHKKMAEEVQQVDELKASTLGSYIKKASVDAKFKGFDAGYREGDDDARRKKMGSSGAGADLDDKAHKRLAGVKKATDKLTAKAMKEAAELDEGRGRPRKNPLPAGSGEEPGEEPDHNIVMHLKKSVDTNGNHDVKFSDSKTHKVPSHVAKTVLHAMGKLKPADRLEIQKHIGQSHSNLMQVHGMIK